MVRSLIKTHMDFFAPTVVLPASDAEYTSHPNAKHVIYRNPSMIMVFYFYFLNVIDTVMLRRFKSQQCHYDENELCPVPSVRPTKQDCLPPGHEYEDLADFRAIASRIVLLNQAGSLQGAWKQATRRRLLHGVKADGEGGWTPLHQSSSTRLGLGAY